MGWYTRNGFYVSTGVVYDSTRGCFVDEKTGKRRMDVDIEWGKYKDRLRREEEKENPLIAKKRKCEYNPDVPFFCQ